MPDAYGRRLHVHAAHALGLAPRRLDLDLGLWGLGLGRLRLSFGGELLASSDYDLRVLGHVLLDGEGLVGKLTNFALQLVVPLRRSKRGVWR